MKTPLRLLRPIKISDGQGGSVVTLTEVATIWGHLKLHDNIIKVVGVDVNEDVQIMDEIEA